MSTRAQPPAHHRDVSARFSAAAPQYAAVSRLQDKVARRLMDIVPSDFQPHTVLDAGCGSGRLIYLARKRWPDARHRVDIAPGMIAEAARGLGNDPQASLFVADIARFEPETRFDLLLSSSALHWLRPFNDGLARAVSLCRPGGIAAVSVMLYGTLRELHEARRRAAPDKTPPGRLPTFEECEAAARAIAGFRVRRIEQVDAEHDQPSAANVLKLVHAMGVTGGDVSRAETPLTRAELRELTECYDSRFAVPAGVRVTFRVGYLLLERE